MSLPILFQMIFGSEWQPWVDVKVLVRWRNFWGWVVLTFGVWQVWWLWGSGKVPSMFLPAWRPSMTLLMWLAAPDNHPWLYRCDLQHLTAIHDFTDVTLAAPYGQPWLYRCYPCSTWRPFMTLPMWLWQHLTTIHVLTDVTVAAPDGLALKSILWPCSLCMTEIGPLEVQ